MYQAEPYEITIIQLFLSYKMYQVNKVEPNTYFIVNCKNLLKINDGLSYLKHISDLDLRISLF